jgi:hypothetical protein
LATPVVLLTYDLFEDSNASCQIIAIHYEWRKDAKRMFSGAQGEQPFVPSTLDDFVGGLHDIQPPDEAGSTDRPHFPGAASEGTQLLAEPRAVFADGAQQRWIRQTVEDMRRDRGYKRTAPKRRTVITRLDRGRDIL